VEKHIRKGQKEPTTTAKKKMVKNW